MPTPELSEEQWRRDRVEDIGLDGAGVPRRPVVVVTQSEDARGSAPRAVRAPGPVVIVAADDPGRLTEDLDSRADVVIGARASGTGTVVTADPLGEARRVAASIEAHPVAALTLAWLLRCQSEMSLEGALLAESTAYSTLLASEEFKAWRRASPTTPGSQEVGRVKVAREDDRLLVTLANPDRRNAMDARMRDELFEALQPAVWDRTLTVEIRAEGPSSGSGGDLAEFGLSPDVARAHLTRSTSSLGLLLDELGARVVVYVHGPCFGAGIEVPAFARRIVAKADATFTLPELAMGLIPGAGGTVSIARRVGRRRAAWLALSGSPLNAETALSWGLVDRVE